LIKIVPSEGLTQEHIDSLRRTIGEYVGQEILVDFSFVSEIPFTPSGKFRYTISRVPVKFS